MNPRPSSRVLDDITVGKIPADLDLAPRILDQARRDRRLNPLRPRAGLAFTILMVFLSLLVLTSVAYAIYRLAGDPGLQAVQDAGLVKDIAVTARPTLLPTATAVERPAAKAGLSQTVNGVSLTLDWVYMDEGRLAFRLATGELPQGLSLGDPAVTFQNAAPRQMLGWAFNLGETTAQYISYQVVHAGDVDGKAHLSLDLPLMRASETLGTFHFDLLDVPVYEGQTLFLQQTYAVRLNGIEARLRSARVTPSETEIVACTDVSTASGAAWEIQSASLQVGDGAEVVSQPVEPLPEINDDHCVRLKFPQGGGPRGAARLVFRVGALTAGPEQRAGPWEFHIDLPQTDLASAPPPAGLPASPTPSSSPALTATPAAPLASQTQAGVTVTLDWAFADAQRIAVGYTITGLPDVPEASDLLGTSYFADGNGQPLWWDDGSTSIERVEGQPGVLRGVRSLVFEQPIPPGQANFQFVIALGSDQRSDVIAQFPIAPEATPYPPGVFPPPLPDHVIGAFTFDFSVPVYGMITLEPRQDVTANGIVMRLERVEMTPSYSRIELCFQKPSAQDWLVGGSSIQPRLEFGGASATISTYGLIYDTDLGGYTGKSPTPTGAPSIQTGRCVILTFMMGHSNHAGTVTLTIPDLTQSVPEVIPDDEDRAAQEKLKAEGIEMNSWMAQYSGGGGGGGPQFTTLPEGMTQMEAYQRYLEALGYVRAGPWVFTLVVQP